MVQDLRQLIRSILIEELADHGVAFGGGRPPEARQEFVSIQSDADLARFVERLLHMTRDDHRRTEIESGRLVFRLEGSASKEVSPERYAGHRTLTAGRTGNFPRGLITESRVHELPADVEVVVLGRNAVLTPLAKDAIRQAGLKIERVKT